VCFRQPAACRVSTAIISQASVFCKLCKPAEVPFFASAMIGIRHDSVNQTELIFLTGDCRIFPHCLSWQGPAGPCRSITPTKVAVLMSTNDSPNGSPPYSPTSGINTENRLPFSRVLSTTIRPWCISTITWATERPNPNPPRRRTM